MFSFVGRGQITKNNGGNPLVKNRSVNWLKKTAIQGVMDTVLVLVGVQRRTHNKDQRPGNLPEKENVLVLGKTQETIPRSDPRKKSPVTKQQNRVLHIVVFSFTPRSHVMV